MRASLLSSAAAKPQLVSPWYRPEIDVLRFVCFLLVFFHHTAGDIVGYFSGPTARWGAALQSASGFGADLFFVLSSFLITSLLLREIKVTGRLEARTFYIRRALRIWPLYFVALFLIIWLERLQPSHERLQPIHVAAMLLFAGNWSLAFWPVATFATPLWSLSMQEQFYLLWPWVLKKLRIPALVMVCLSAILVGCLFRGWATHAGHTWQLLHFSTFSSLDAFAMGALLAVALRGDLPRISSLRRLCLGTVCAAGLLWICLPGSHATSRTEFEIKFWYPLAALCCTGLLVSVLGASGAVAGLIFRSRILTYLGRITYGLYIWHPAAIFLLSQALVPAWLATTWLRRLHNGQLWVALAVELLSFACTFCVAVISYHGLEKPCMKLKSRLQPQRKPPLQVRHIECAIERPSSVLQEAAG